MYTLPTHISRYEIKHRIGRGGMGDLYLALDPNTNRLVALKLLNATLDSAELRERFAREARALAALNHPNIVNIYDTGEFEDSPFIVMEYVRGETLAELIKRRAPLSLAQKLKLVEELCAGLAQAHEAGIIHRDIKPANLMVDQQGRLKILDFGIARVAEGNKTRVGPLTQLNMQIGTPGYMSPEQTDGGEVDHRSDIFAVGAVCYELLAYDEAFAGANTRQIENRVRRGQPAPLASLIPGIDPEIDEIVRRALKTDPNKRYQDAATFERALERLRSRLGPEAAAAPQRPTPPPPQNQRGKSREARAEAAYQRALASVQTGSPDAARRFAVEALAEDPSHAGAHALLAQIERRPPVVDRKPSPPPRVIQTIVETSVGGAGPTMVSEPTMVSNPTRVSEPTRVSDATMLSNPTRRAEATRASGRTVSGAPSASAPTIVVPPSAATRAMKGPPAWKRMQSLWGRVAQATQRPARTGKRYAASGKAHQPLWERYRGASIAAAVVLGLVAIAAAVMVILWMIRPSGLLLTITKPTNGTISAPGIRCGTRGNDCTINRPKDENIELSPEPDAGYAFVGYTGDCAPGGRTVMSAARTCGATFEKMSDAALPPTRLLTIAPMPSGGTVEGVDILCGSKGTACSANHPDNVIVDLIATADQGFTFMGFLGDCAPLGKTQMVGPRTCSASFQRTSLIAGPPPPPPGPPIRRPGGPSPVPGTAPTAPSGTNTGTGTARGSNPTTPTPGQQPSGETPIPAGDPKKVEEVVTPEQFATKQIVGLLKQFCAAHDAIDPEAVQRVYPTAKMDAWRMQLNKSMYKSIRCAVKEPLEFQSLDPAHGTAKIDAELTRVWEHTVNKPETTVHIATMTLSRPSERAQWQIDTASFRLKPPPPK